MKIIISPAKKMKINTDAFEALTRPVFLKEAEMLLNWMQSLSYADAKNLWACSDSIAGENFARIQSMDLQRALTPAIISYDGIQYTYMAPAVFEESQHTYIQEHLRILSGFYGVLKPMDGVTPYRLEMQAKADIAGSRDLYGFWKNKLYREVRDKSGVIINLASKEYSKCIERYLQPVDRYITCIFGELEKGKVVQKGVYAKMARGEMVRFMAEIQAEEPEQIKAFCWSGYRFDEDRSSETEYVFIRSVIPGKEKKRYKDMRQNNIMMLQDTLRILEQGYYTVNGHTVRLKLSRQEMEEAHVFLPEDVKKICRFKDFEHVHMIGRCGYGCENEDSFTLARKRLEQTSYLRTEDDKPILVLNLANATHMGGGVRRGAKAQEEDFCRKSSLLLSLESKNALPYYEYNRSLHTEMGSDAVIIHPQVEIIKDGNGNLLDDSVIAAVMTCAAPNLYFGTEGLSKQEYENMLYQRITGMLKVAARFGYRFLVLGAFGCGAFGNDARIVSDLFYKALKEFDFDGMKEKDMFRRIDFAVMDHSADQYNFREFSRNFDHFYWDEDNEEIRRALDKIKETEVKLDQIRGSMIGGAIGDALGYAIEFSSENEIFGTYGSDGITEYRLTEGKALISDDTQMALFTANGILVGETRFCMRGIGGIPHAYVGDAYQDWMKTQISKIEKVNKHERLTEKGGRSWLLDVPELYARRAPGNTCISALAKRAQMEYPGDYLSSPVNDSKGCGGVMRIAPLALKYKYFVHQEDLDLEAAQLAAITHSHSLGYMPAAVVCHIISGILLSYPEKSLKEIVLEARDTAKKLFEGDPYLPNLTEMIDRAVLLSENDAGDLENIHALGEGWVAEETMAIAIYCALKYQNDFSKAVIVSVNHRGDSDSTGAVTGNIVGAMVGYDAIEEKWKKNLELQDVILEMADDLCHGCQMSEYSHYRNPEWEVKYMEMHRPVKQQPTVSGSKNTAEIRMIRGDITRISDVEAIVNAANRSLLGGGGVDGAIHRAAGPKLLAECRTLHGCNTGEAKLTNAYDLPCRYVIHTVGPVWHGGKRNEAELLADCYKNSLQIAVQKGIRRIAFPSISTGVYSYPVEEAAKIAVYTVDQFIEEHPGQLDLVEWVLFDQATYDVYDDVLNQLTVSKIVHSPRLDEINRALRDGLV